MAIDRKTGTLKVRKFMPGVSLEKLQENTTFKVETFPTVSQVQPPTEEELTILRRDVDPEGEYLGKES